MVLFVIIVVSVARMFDGCCLRSERQWILGLPVFFNGVDDDVVFFVVENDVVVNVVSNDVFCCCGDDDVVANIVIAV